MGQFLTKHFRPGFQSLNFLLILLVSLLPLAQEAKVYSISNAFYSEYCGFNSSPIGTNTVTCTFSTPQSDIIRHSVSLAQISKPSNQDICFSVTYSLTGLSPHPSSSITVTVSSPTTLKLGFFVVLIKNQPLTKYVDFIQLGINSMSTLNDASNTVRTQYQDKNINTLTTLTTVDANNLLIVPFVTSYAFYLSTTLTNIAGSEYDFTFLFDYQVLSSFTVRMKITIQPSVSMREFYGCMLLVNIQQIQAQKSAYLLNPTLTATDYSQKLYNLGNPGSGKLTIANLQTDFSSFGTPFTGKCLLGFDSVSYTKLTQFSFQLAKNAFNNFNTFSQTVTTTIIPQMRANYFCYGLAMECSDSTTYYDMMDTNCYNPSTCPLPVPGLVGAWPHTNICPWCEALICSNCNPANRPECNTCSPGSRSILNPTTKKCECQTGYYAVLSNLSPVTWNGQTQTHYLCSFDCSYAYPGCKKDKCTTYCIQCQDEYLLTVPASGNQYCEICSSFLVDCFKCSSTAYCTMCMDGFYLIDITIPGAPTTAPAPPNPPVLVGRECLPCLANCKSCLDGSSCNTCFSGYQLNGPKTTCTCNVTLASLQNCNSCTVNITCANCVVGFYISAINGLCDPCTHVDIQCNACNNIHQCTNCNTGYGLDTTVMTGNVMCSLCNKIIQYCDDCHDINNCAHCVAPYGLASPILCMYCEVLRAPGCIECTSALADCTKCNATSFLINGTCYFCQLQHAYCTSCQINRGLKILQCLTCQTGYYLDLNPITSQNECYVCPDAMHKCLECKSKSFCTKCEFPNKIGADNQCSQCEFPYVNYNGLCMTNVGCMNALQTSPGIMICLACRDYIHFIYQPQSQTCICDIGYLQTIGFQPDKKCVPICGDGLLIQSYEKCDDKNLINHDGCDSNCKQETNFICNQTSPSHCILYRDFTKFQFLYAKRVQTENKGILYFSIEPKQIGLSTVDWSKMIKLNFAAKAVKTSSCTFKYSFQTGQLQVQFPYTQTVQNSLLEYEVVFDPTKIISNPTSFKSVNRIQGINSPLIVQDSMLLQNSKLISSISLVLSVLVLIQFYLGSYVGKMIGLQTIQIFHFVCFVRILIFTKNTTMLDSLNPLKYSSQGYSNPDVLFKDSSIYQNQLIYYEFNNIDLQKYYLLNINFWLLPIILVFTVYLVVSIRKFFEWRALVNGQDPGAKYKYVLTRRTVQYIYDQLIFPQIMMISMLVYFNYLLNLMPGQVSTTTKITPIQLYSMTFLTLSQYAIFAIFAFETVFSLKQMINIQLKIPQQLSFFQKFEVDEESQHRPNYHSLYIFVYLVYYFILTLAMSFDKQIAKFTFGLEIVMVLTIGYFLIIYFWSPYVSAVNLHNTFLKVNHGIAVVILIIFQVFNRSNQLTPITYTALSYLILALLLIVLMGGFARVYVEHLYRKKLGIKGRGKSTLLDGETFKVQTKQQRKEALLQDNSYTFRNQLEDLKKTYYLNKSHTMQNNILAKDEEQFFINKIKDEYQLKNALYQDFWGKNYINQELTDQIIKPNQEVEIQDKKEKDIEENKNGTQQLNTQKEKYSSRKNHSKHSQRQKQHLTKLKLKLRNELRFMNFDDKE